MILLYAAIAALRRNGGMPLAAQVPRARPMSLLLRRFSKYASMVRLVQNK